MPHQYRLHYDWEWAGVGGGMKPFTHKRLPNLGLGRQRSWRDDLGVDMDRGGGAGRRSEGSQTEGGLERVVLPAGYTVFFTPGSGTPLTRSHSSKGRPTKSGVKGLGVVDPVCRSHSRVEEEYVLTRQAVEMFLEKKLTGLDEDCNLRVGGTFDSQQQFLDKLAQTSPDSHDHPQESPQADADNQAGDKEDDTDLPAMETSQPAVPCTKDNGLPASKTQQSDESVQHSFLMEGRGIGDRGRGQKTTWNREGGQKPLTARPTKEPPATERLPRPEVQEGVLTVVKIPLSSRLGDRKEQEFERNFNVIRRVNQMYSDRGLTRQQQLQKSIQLALPYLFQTVLPLEVVSARSTLTIRPTTKGREQAGLTPCKTTRSANEMPLNGKPPSTTFRPKKTESGAPAKQEFWRPLLSRKEHNPYPSRFSNVGETERVDPVEGRNVVNRVPSRVVLNVVLPKEKKSRDGRLCGRQVMVSKPLQAWLSSPPFPVPPPPPTPTVPSGFCDGDLGNDLGGTLGDGDLGDNLGGIHGDGDLGRTLGDGGLVDNLGGNLAKDVHVDDEKGERKAESVEPSLPTEEQNLSLDEPEKETSPKLPPLSMNESKHDFQGQANLPTANKLNAKVEMTLPIVGFVPETKEDPQIPTTVPISQPAWYPPPPPSPVDVDIGSTPWATANPTSRSAGHTKPVFQNSQITNPYPASRSAVQPKPIFQDPQETNPYLASLSAPKTKPVFQDTQTAKEPPRQRTLSGCRRATHCDLFGPVLCADCEAALHRQQFTKRQDLLYPHISVSPVHMVASQRLKARKVADASRRSKTTLLASRWPYTSVSQLKSVITDWDLCRRIVERGHRARLYTSL